MSNQVKEFERNAVIPTGASSSTPVGKILVVDDEPELKLVLVESLQRHGFEVTGCGSGHDALGRLRERDFDLILTDLMMPEMDGITLLKAALEIDPHLVGIIVTGQGTIQTAVDAMQTGAFDYVLKPFRMQTLIPVLTRAMNVRHLKLENVQLRETVAIHSLCQTISFTLDSQTVLSKLADAALQQSDADEVSILLPTNDGAELYVAAVRGEKRERLLGERVPLQESISSWVARERKPLILNGEVHDKRFVALWPRPEIRSAVSVPMQVANKLVGIINLNMTNRLRPFTLGQMKALTILASTAAAALESSSLFTQVQQAEKNYRSIFENAIEGVFQSTPQGRFITVNPSLARILGYDSPDEMIATITNIAEQLYVDPEARARASQIQKERGVLHDFEFEAYRKDGEKIWLSVNRRSVWNEDGTELYRQGSVLNITERKRLEAALLASEGQLRQSQKLEAIGQLAGGVAHDFNNLLTAINGYSALALRRVGHDHPIASYLEEIKKAGDRAANLTRQLLAFGRKQLLQPLSLNLNDVVADMSKMLKRLIGENIDFVAKLRPDLKQIKADPGQVEQVLVNLVVNARDSMPKGGKLTIETANVELDGIYASQHVGVTAGKYVMLAVSDTGTGMNHDTRTRIFEPFFTTKERGKGTGLGLSTVYGIVKQSGGNVWVYSEPGRGTTFKVYLPQLESDVSSFTGAEPEVAIRRGTETVLLVEDEDMVRNLAIQLLAESGYSVLEASGGEEAISLCENYTERIDLLITDVVMPKMSGKDVADRLRTIHPETKVLFMSGYTDEAIVHHGIVDSHIAFIQKPFSEVALAQKIRDVLDAENGHR